MENLEEKSNEGKTVLKDSLKKYTPLYKGLELIEESDFNSGTSEKYWM